LDSKGLRYQHSRMFTPELAIVPPEGAVDHNVRLMLDGGDRFQFIMSGWPSKRAW
jgi:hypothetical protein